MSLISFASLAFALALQAAPAPAPVPTAEPDPSTEAAELPEPATAPLTWESLPEDLRKRLEEQMSKPEPQAVLVVEAAAAPDADFRTLDHGDVLSEQVVRPAAFATIVTPARNARKYGPAGAVLWAGIDGDGDWWCWRNGDRYPGWTRPSDIYCYRDADNDGKFDVVKRNASPGQSLGQSRFQFTDLGRDERLADVVTYTSGGQADFAEKVVIRYDGPGSAKVGADGRLIDGEVHFHLLTGPAIARSAPAGNLLVQPAQTQPEDGLDLVAPIRVRLDSDGRGHYSDARGIVIEVDRVDLDGKARAKLVSALPAGRALLVAPPTREELLQIVAMIMRRGPR